MSDIDDKKGMPWIVHDILASIVVFLVALPLCVGIAIASGASPVAGLITGIVGGLIVGPLSGCPLQISGPAAGLAVIVAQLISEHGLERLGLVIMVAGLIQLLVGLCRFAQWFRAVPPSVVHGMLSGIGILIFASQFHVMFDESPKESGLMNLISIPLAMQKGLSFNTESTHFQACCIGLLTIVLIVLWKTFYERSQHWLFKLAPPSLVAILIASVAAWFYGLQINFVNLPDNFVDSVKLVDFSLLQSQVNWQLLLDGIAVAFIAAAETLLTATAVDKMHKGPKTNYDRELLAQGVGNMTCGFVGGLPMTGVIVRSGVNVSAGAKTRASAFLHGLWLLCAVALIPFVVEMIPKAALAALLVYTGWKLANLGIVKELRKFGKSEVYIYAATILAIICLDLLFGVLIGIGLSVCKLIYLFSHLDIRATHEEKRTDIHLTGVATFLSLPRLAETFESVDQNAELHVHLEGLEYIDHACLEMIVSWEEQHMADGGHLTIDWGESRHFKKTQ